MIMKQKVSLKILVLLSLIFVSISVNAEICEGYYVTNSLDTIKCKMNITSNIFHKNLYNFHHISQGIRLADDEGKKKFKPQEIASFTVFVPSGDTCKFVSVPTDKHYFYHEMIVGKISMYLKYHTHGYDGGMISELIFLKDNKFTALGTMSTKKSQKKKIALLLSDNPEVLAKWETTKLSSLLVKAVSTLQEILNEYNQSQNND